MKLDRTDIGIAVIGVLVLVMVLALAWLAIHDIQSAAIVTLFGATLGTGVGAIAGFLKPKGDETNINNENGPNGTTTVTQPPPDPNPTTPPPAAP